MTKKDDYGGAHCRQGEDITKLYDLVGKNDKSINDLGTTLRAEAKKDRHDNNDMITKRFLATEDKVEILERDKLNKSDFKILETKVDKKLNWDIFVWIMGAAATLLTAILLAIYGVLGSLGEKLDKNAIDLAQIQTTLTFYDITK